MNRQVNRFRCPECDGFARVEGASKWQDGMVQRIRICTGCGHTFITYESTTDPRATRQRIAAVKAQLDEFNETVQGW